MTDVRARPIGARTDTQSAFDAVIVGAGAAGLSLACHLAHVGWGDKVLLVDDGSHPLEQRSWAWWSTGRGLLDSEASTALDRLWVAGFGWRRSMPLTPYSYRRITGPELSAATDRMSVAMPGHRRMAGSVSALVQESSGCRVLIDLSEPGETRSLEVSARWVFDSVGLGSSPTPPASAAHLDFLGLHVECQTDTFDPSTATLMDFRTDQSDGVAFMYVLPVSSRSALVERTVFAFADDDHRELVGSRHEAHVRDYIQTHIGAGGYRVTGHEVGSIPLQRGRVPTPTGAVIPIGARAGMVKASTGYGFERIQRHSAAIASRLASGQSPVNAAPAHRWSRALDDALLRVIREDPARAVEVFRTMLTRNPGSRILAFLDEEASLRDQLALFATLPWAPFVRAQVRFETGQATARLAERARTHRRERRVGPDREWRASSGGDSRESSRLHN